MYEQLFRNTYGTIVDIISRENPIALMSMLLNPITYSALERGHVEVGEGSKYTASFKKISQENSEITYELDKDSVFILVLTEKVFLNNDKIVVKTVRGKGAYLNDVLLCFQGENGFAGAVKNIRDMYGCEVNQLMPTIVQYEGFDAMIRAYRDKKSPEDLAIEAAIKQMEESKK